MSCTPATMRRTIRRRGSGAAGAAGEPRRSICSDRPNPPSSWLSWKAGFRTDRIWVSAAGTTKSTTAGSRRDHVRPETCDLGGANRRRQVDRHRARQDGADDARQDSAKPGAHPNAERFVSRLGTFQGHPGLAPKLNGDRTGDGTGARAFHQRGQPSPSRTSTGTGWTS